MKLYLIALIVLFLSRTSGIGETRFRRVVRLRSELDENDNRVSHKDKLMDGYRLGYSKHGLSTVSREQILSKERG